MHERLTRRDHGSVGAGKKINILSSYQYRDSILALLASGLHAIQEATQLKKLITALFIFRELILVMHLLSLILFKFLLTDWLSLKKGIVLILA
ncbi:MAG: hypothetical protein GY847_37590 [Proteobacteria bacterium]|nr:hypothetical protein [Pseudomonadota bacterium]